MISLQNENDKRLVFELRNNKINAFDAIFHKYSDKLYRFAFSLLKNDEDSKGIVQETFLKLWKNRNDIDTSKSLKSYLFTISYHLIIDQLRYRLKDVRYREFLYRYFENNSFIINSKFDFDVLNRQIEAAVEELPDKRKQIYLLSREKGYSHKEIADKLGLSVKTVENQINRSLNHFRMRLGNDIRGN